MSIAQTLLPEFDQEMRSTRRLLERIPDADASWKPHEKSWTLGELSMHVANVPNWLTMTLDRDVLDLASTAEGRDRAFESTSALVTEFEAAVAGARQELEKATDDHMRAPWTLKTGGEVFLEMPRIAVVRSFVMNHLIHHRGQLTVYLRMLNVELPEIYGPTADSAPAASR